MFGVETEKVWVQSPNVWGTNWKSLGPNSRCLGPKLEKSYVIYLIPHFLTIDVRTGLSLFHPSFPILKTYITEFYFIYILCM